MDQEATLEFLEHYGVKGMHWGIRTEKPPKRMSSDYKKTAAYRSRHPQELTNKQLKAVNERLNLETNYKRMNPHTIKKGMAAAAGILAAVELVNKFANISNSTIGKMAISAGAKHVVKKKAMLKSTAYFLEKVG